jgi:hypothetical protein
VCEAQNLLETKFQVGLDTPKDLGREAIGPEVSSEGLQEVAEACV